jgi:penicillin-binding protein 1A
MIRFLGFLFSFAVLGGLAAVGAVGVMIWLYEQELPDTDVLANYEPATLTRVYSGEGALLAEFARERRIFTPIDEVPDLVKSAFISAEDKNFYEHPGVDPIGIARAMLANIESLRSGGGRLQGASTITQQVMKNFLLSSDRSIERKIKEAILAVRMSETMSKERILELYLNEIFLGQNAYGVAAAAQRYFGKTLEDLTLAEAAYLAALPKAPSDLHPVRQRDRAIERRNYVLREMRENGYISETEMTAAQAEPLVTLLDDGALEPEIARPAPPSHFTEEVRRRMSDALGEDALFAGGLTVRATIDPRLQAVAARALRERLESWDRERGAWRGPVATLEAVDLSDEAGWRAALAAVEAPRDIPGWRLAVVLDLEADAAIIGVEGTAARGRLPLSDAAGWARVVRANGATGSVPRNAADLWSVGDVLHVAPAREGGDLWSLRQTPELQGAFMAMDAQTGRVLALQGGFSYETSVFNRATQALRQPGSAIKPFVYAAALEAGYGPDTMILDAPIVVDQGTGELWKPKNSSGTFYGPAPMRIGLEMSRNLMTIRLAQEIGMERVSEAAERFGLYEDMPHHLSYALGAGETTLWDLVAAYAMFANGGYRIEPTVVDRVQDRRGETIWRHEPQTCVGCAANPDAARAPSLRRDAERVIDPVAAHEIVAMLRGVVERGTAARAFAGVPGPVAGKTGTTNESRDAWFIGFSPELAVGCFIGYDSPRPMGEGAFGGTLCAPVVAAFFDEVNRLRPPGGFDALDDALIAAALDSESRVGTITAGLIGGDDDFFSVSASDFPFSLAPAGEGDGAADDGAFAADPGAPDVGAAPTRPAPPQISGGFASPGGLY